MDVLNWRSGRHSGVNYIVAEKRKMLDTGCGRVARLSGRGVDLEVVDDPTRLRILSK